MRARLQALVATPPRDTPWEKRPLLLSVSVGAMRRVVGARDLRRAVSKEATMALDEDTAADIVGHNVRTMRAYYMGGAPASARKWAEVLASVSR